MTNATDFADAHCIAKSLLAEADSGAPTAQYAKAKIAALQMAVAAGAICPNIREVGQACQSMSGISAYMGGRMLMHETAENIFELTKLGKMVASYLPGTTQESETTGWRSLNRV